MVPDHIERETVIDAPVDRVWELLTSAEHLGTWFGDAGAEIDLRPGGTMVLRWTEHGTARARVERVEPHRRFAFRWALEADMEVTDDLSTLVEFTLEEDAGRTRVRVVESGFARLAVDDERRERHHADNTDGWRIKLGDLAEHAERAAV